MKIYITNIDLNNIKNNINKLSNFLTNKNGIIYIELCSEEHGIYIIDDSSIYKLEHNSNEKYELIRNYNGFDLLVEYSENNKKQVLSQLPTNFILTKKLIFEYKIVSKSNLSLVLECIELNTNEINITETNKSIDYINILNTDCNLDVIDFYFIYKNDNLDIKNIFLQEELNMFLFNLK
jgi:hypothetical protein